MILDYIEKSGAYVLRVVRGEADPAEIMREHGLDMSLTHSTDKTAVLFTREPYAAIAFWKEATPAAQAQLRALSHEIALSWAADSAGHYSVPPDQELWPFQKASLAYALRRSHTLIGDQPGLGKTNTAIVFCNEVRAKRVLVICPASIRRQWAARIWDWSTRPRPFTIHPIMHSRNGVHPTAAWTITSYELARTPAIGSALAKGLYDVVILDEAHYLKTSDSRRTRAIFGGGVGRTFEPLSSRTGAILALSGTPLPNRPREAYALARALDWGCIDWLSEEAFKERFNPSMKREVIDKKTGRSRIFIDERIGRAPELGARMRANIMVRHLKRDVMAQLKMPSYDIVQAEETGPVKQALRAESLLDIDPEDLQGADATILGQVATARKMMGLALAPQVADYVDLLLDSGEEKIVVFAWHVEVLDILERRLARHQPVRVDGSTSSKSKDRFVQQFVENPRTQVMLGNILSLGTGTDGLQKVSAHAVIAEPSWVPGENVQAFDRLDRGGQARTVQGDIFVAPGSFAERILASALRKGRVIHNTLDERPIFV